MKKVDLERLVKKFDIDPNELEYSYEDFNTPVLCVEACPTCGEEEDIKQDGTSDCTTCGHKNLRPCSMCPLMDMSACDWSGFNGCTPFPKVIDMPNQFDAIKNAPVSYRVYNKEGKIELATRKLNKASDTSVHIGECSIIATDTKGFTRNY
jgi:hypothetical protein